MAAIAGIPGLIALIVTLRRGPAHALIDVYLPVLLLLPDYYRWVLPGLPDPTFNEAAIIPIATMFVLREARRWRFSAADLLIVGLGLEMAYSEFINTNYSDSQNLMFDCLANIIAPYMLAKGLVETHGLRVEFARKFCGLIAIVAVASVFEFRMGMNPFQMILGRFFPGQEGWVTTFRYGFARIAGPYGHAILAGVIFAVAYRMQRWLQWNGYWEGRLKWLPLGAARFITYAIAAGGAMTLCRGPWIGAFFGMIAILLGRAANRRLALTVILALVLVVGTPAYVGFKAYVSVGRAGAKSVSQETAAYRKELLDKYIAIAEEHAAFGWGRNGWPRVPGMPSIDNYYLLLSLMHGVTALALLLSVFIWMIARLGRYGWARPWSSPSGSLAFSLLGAYLAAMVSIATVYLAMQAVQVLFLMTGWAEGLVLGRGDQAAQSRKDTVAAAPPTRFKRVMY
jgi:O-Antigen ligase